MSASQQGQQVVTHQIRNGERAFGIVRTNLRPTGYINYTDPGEDEFKDAGIEATRQSVKTLEPVTKGKVKTKAPTKKKETGDDAEYDPTQREEKNKAARVAAKKRREAVVAKSTPAGPTIPFDPSRLLNLPVEVFLCLVVFLGLSDLYWFSVALKRYCQVRLPGIVWDKALKLAGIHLGTDVTESGQEEEEKEEEEEEQIVMLAVAPKCKTAAALRTQIKEYQHRVQELNMRGWKNVDFVRENDHEVIPPEGVLRDLYYEDPVFKGRTQVVLSAENWQEQKAALLERLQQALEQKTTKDLAASEKKEAGAANVMRMLARVRSLLPLYEALDPDVQALVSELALAGHSLAQGEPLPFQEFMALPTISLYIVGDTALLPDLDDRKHLILAEVTDWLKKADFLAQADHLLRHGEPGLRLEWTPFHPRYYTTPLARGKLKSEGIHDTEVAVFTLPDASQIELARERCQVLQIPVCADCPASKCKSLAEVLASATADLLKYDKPFDTWGWYPRDEVSGPYVSDIWSPRRRCDNCDPELVLRRAQESAQRQVESRWYSRQEREARQKKAMDTQAELDAFLVQRDARVKVAREELERAAIETAKATGASFAK